MRTDEEILAKYKLLEGDADDFFGFQKSDLIGFLPFDLVKDKLKEDYVTKVEAGEEEWKPDPRDRESILKQMKEYMSFAWEKANDCRGISAARSMNHYTVWIWMIGDEEKFDNLNRYQYYGKLNLIKICEEYGWDHEQWDDGERVN